MHKQELGGRKGGGNEEEQRLDENTVPAIDRELLLKCVRLEADEKEQAELRRLTDSYKSWQEAYEAVCREEDVRAAQEALTEEGRRWLAKTRWEDANLTQEERSERRWNEIKDVYESGRQTPTTGSPEINKSEDA